LCFLWFDLLNSRKICQKTLKEDLKVHLINYQQTDLQFYALVDHNSLNTCISPSEAFAFFKKHGFTIVSMKEIGEFDNFNDLKTCLKIVFSSVAQSSIEDDGEGSVLYFAEKNGEKEKVLSLCKLKTLEYSIFRKLREKLKTLNSQNYSVHFKKDKLEFLFQRFKKETGILCQDFHPARSFSYYFKIAEKCFSEVLEKQIESIQDNYLGLLTKVRKIVDQEYKEEDKEDNDEFMNAEKKEEITEEKIKRPEDNEEHDETKERDDKNDNFKKNDKETLKTKEFQYENNEKKVANQYDEEKEKKDDSPEKISPFSKSKKQLKKEKKKKKKKKI